MCRVLIADDHPLVRDGLRTVLGVTFDRAELFEAEDLDEVIRVVALVGDFDLVLLDVNMPGMCGLAGVARVREQFPALPIVVISASYDHPLVSEAIRMGAAGFVPKTLPRSQIVEALRCVYAGGIYVPPEYEEVPGLTAEQAEIRCQVNALTEQQRRVLQLIVEGLLNKEIAFRLGISDSTVKAHVSAILQKLHVVSRTQAVIAAKKIGLDQSADPLPARRDRFDRTAARSSVLT